MPAYKVPCPRCGQFIMRDVAVCPFCRTADPFAPARCAACSTILEDPRWTVCPRCGAEVPKVAPATSAPAGAQVATPRVATPGVATPSPSPSPGAQPAPAAPAAAAVQPAPASPAPSQGRACSGCGAPLAAGARFCAVCGTIAG